MDSTVSLSLIALVSVVVTGILTPVVVSFVQYILQRRKNIEDYARQDAVAAKLLAANERVAAATESTKDKLEEVKVIGEKNHALSNSALTAVMQLTLNATERELGSMIRELSAKEELIEIKRLSGHDPTPDAIATIAVIRASIATLGERVVEMRAAVDVRLKQQEKQDAKNV